MEQVGIFPDRDRQKGMSTLAVTMVLLLVATLATLSAGRAGLAEQSISAVDMRSKEVYAAASGGLDYAVHLLEKLVRGARANPNGSAYSFLGLWEGVGIGARITVNAEQNSHLLPDVGYPVEMGTDSYVYDIRYTAITPVEYDAVSDAPLVIEISVTAQALQDTHVVKTMYVDVMLSFTSLFSWRGDHFFAPPLVVEDCILDDRKREVRVAVDTGPLVGTTKGLSAVDSVENCLPVNDMQICADGYGGSCSALSFEAVGAAEPQGTLWDSVFGAISQAELREVALANPEQIFWVDEGYPYLASQPAWDGTVWTRDVGKPEHPVILFFDKSVGCPRINGMVNIHGIVYFDSAGCAEHDLGQAHIVGTVAVSGDLHALNGDASIKGSHLDFTGDAPDPRFSWTSRFHFFEVPGSWRDF